MLSLRNGLAFTGLFSLAALGGADDLRIATWNISLYNSGRVADIQNAVYGSFQGRSMRPDVILAQEIQSPAAATSFLNALNGAGAASDWTASYSALNGTSRTNDQVVFYRSSKVSLFGSPNLVLGAQGTSGSPRDVYRWDFKLANFTATQTLSFYDVHLKAGEGSDRDGSGDPTNNDRRKAATDAIRADANGLDANHHVVVGGDFNVQSSNQTAYQSLIGSQSDNSGRFFDPIRTPGSWNNNGNYRFVHTQDPGVNGQMDDRHDQILMGGSLFDGQGLDYVGNSSLAYSTTTWNDPNHSYRAWGNDGTSYNAPLTIAGNAMVGSSIAQSLSNLATTGGGHLPVFLDLRYQPVPEPATLAVLGLGALGVLRRRKR